MVKQLQEPDSNPSVQVVDGHAPIFPISARTQASGSPVLAKYTIAPNANADKAWSIPFASIFDVIWLISLRCARDDRQRPIRPTAAPDSCDTAKQRGLTVL